MAFYLRLDPKAEKQLNKIEEPYHGRIILLLSSIAANPWMGKKLKGEYKGSYTVRVWPYRVIYDIHKDQMLVLVIKIRHRDHAYD